MKRAADKAQEDSARAEAESELKVAEVQAKLLKEIEERNHQGKAAQKVVSDLAASVKEAKLVE
jgi:hypothetical protein